MRKAMIIHPFLFAIFPILFLFSYNVTQVYFAEILLPLIIVSCFTLFSLLILVLILKNREKAGIIVSIFLALFFSYGHVYNMILDWRISGFLISRHRYLMLIWIMLLVWGVYFTTKIRRNLDDLTKILNITAFSLILISLVNIGIYEFKIKLSSQNKYINLQAKEVNAIDIKNRATLRDIYYIILDGYAASNTLKEIYSYDNSKFIEYLNKKGFYIASESRSNYVHTILSLTSSLNMEYLNFLSDKIELKGREKLCSMIKNNMFKNNKVMNFLKSKGYKFIYFGSGFVVTSHNKYADLEFYYGRISEFSMIMIRTTMLMPFQKYFIAYDARDRILRTFSKLSQIHEIEGPKFVFAHIIPPRPPYIFGANGEIVLDIALLAGGNLWMQKEAYLNQLIFINKKIEVAIDEILSKSKISPIVILQADHGTASSFGSTVSNEWSHNWNHPSKNGLIERTGIFNAYYLPLGGNDLLYSSITPVNTFRLIFNFYFGTDYELLKDRNYFSSYRWLYKFIDVTDKIKYD